MRAGREGLKFDDLAAADDEFTAALALTAHFKRGDPRTKTTTANLERVADLYLSSGRNSDLERIMGLLAGASERDPSIRSPKLAELYTAYGESLNRSGRHADALVALESARSITKETRGGRDASLVAIESGIGLAYLGQGELGLSAEHIDAALAVAKRLGAGTEDALYADGLFARAKLAMAEEREADAEADLLSARAIYQNAFGEDSAAAATAERELSEFYQELGRTAEAEASLERVVAIWDTLPDEGHNRALARNDQAWFLLSAGRPRDAEAPARSALEMLQAADVTGPPIAAVADTLATSLRDQKKYSDAEPIYQLALVEGGAAGALPGFDLRAIAENYAVLLRATGRSDEAETVLKPFEPAMQTPEAETAMDPKDDGMGGP